MEAARMKVIQQQADEIAAIEDRYAKGRKANAYSKDAGASSRQRIAEADVLKYSVDEDGKVRTKQPGGAVDQYKAMTTKPAEGVVRQNLALEGSKVNLSDVQAELMKQVNSSGLEGADLSNALNGVKREVAGLRLKADNLGYVDTTLLHDAKINTYNNIDFQTPPETATYRKAIGRGYKSLIEDNSSFDVAGVNAELAKYYDDVARLERLDGARVKGGRLGKYTSQIVGSIAGGAAGGAVGGPLGIAAGTVVGGEVGGLVKGKTMARTFGEIPGGGKAPTAPVLEDAIKSGQRGNLNLSQSQTTTNASANSIPDSIPPTVAIGKLDEFGVIDELRNLNAANFMQKGKLNLDTFQDWTDLIAKAEKSGAKLTPTEINLGREILRLTNSVPKAPGGTPSMQIPTNSTYFHGADAATAEKINNSGLVASQKSPGYGMVNLTPSEEVAKTYAGNKGTLFNVDVSAAKNIKIYENMAEYSKAIDETGLSAGKAEALINKPYDLVIVKSGTAGPLVLAKPNIVRIK